MIQIDEQDIDKITAVFHAILKGKKAAPIELPPDYPNNEIRQAVDYINKFVVQYNDVTTYVYHLGRGEIDAEAPKGKLIIGQSLKAMQASLRNLTWTTQQISSGDFSQRVSFMGEFSEAFNSMAQRLQTAAQTQEALTQDLQNQVSESGKARKAMLNILEDLEEAKQKADAAAKAKADFLANMSHEIRTPMNAIIGMSHLALQTELNPKQQNYIEKVHRSAGNLLGIINDILDFSKIEAGKLSMEKIEFRLEEVMDNLANLVGMKAEDKGLEMLFSAAPDVPTALVGDPLRLGQILVNLGNNAVKFTEKGEIVIGVETVERTADAVELHFWVKDSGIGMTPEQCGKLFQAFSQADASTTRKFGGTGLGLTISKRLVELMQGRIWVESEAGKGSSFHFHARFGAQKEGVERENYSQDRVDNTEDVMQQLAGTRVLLVEDNDLNQELAQELLQDAGMKVVIANHGQEALDILAKDVTFDGILMDCQMPVMDGYAATREIRKNPAFKDTPIIAMTANAMAGDREKVIEAGMNDHIAKPLDVNQMFATLSRWVAPKGVAVRAVAPGARPATPGSEALPDLPGIDKAAGMATAGNIKLYTRLLIMFRERMASFAVDFAAARIDADTTAAMRSAHTLKGSAGSIGAKGIQKAAAQLEHACQENHPKDTIDALLQATLSELGPVVDGLQRIPDGSQRAGAEGAAGEVLVGNADPAKVKALLDKLKSKLEDSDSEAGDVLEELQALVRGTSMANQLKRVARAVADYDFDAALEGIQKLQ